MKCSHAFFVVNVMIMISFLVCPIMADNEPGVMVILTANSSVITLDENDTYVFTLSEVSPNATLHDVNQTNWTIPLEAAIPTESKSAAIALSGIDGNESIFMGQVSVANYSADLKRLSLNLTQLKYYDGTILQIFNDNKTEIHPGNYTTTSIHIESMIPIPTNSDEDCVREWDDGVCYRRCYVSVYPEVSWLTQKIVSQTPC